jgi:hypothetical protein
MIQRISDDLLWSQIVARAWCDADFMKRLRSDPRAMLAEHGLDVPADTDVQVDEGTEAKVEDTDAVRHFVLPANPPDDLMEEDLAGEVIAWCNCAVCNGCWRCGCGCRRCRCWW